MWPSGSAGRRQRTPAPCARSARSSHPDATRKSRSLSSVDLAWCASCTVRAAAQRQFHSRFVMASLSVAKGCPGLDTQRPGPARAWGGVGGTRRLPTRVGGQDPHYSTCPANAGERLGVSKIVVVKSGGQTRSTSGAGTTSPMRGEPLFGTRNTFWLAVLRQQQPADQAEKRTAKTIPSLSR
jgi:hypothetical protein